jgi:putative Holliday junction resolvase
MVVLGIDVGSVRVGCAWGDSVVKIPFPVAVWERAQARAEKALLQEIESRKAELLVVGLPLGPNGERTPTCDLVAAFVARLSKRTPLKIVYVDESFSSDEAMERLSAAGATPDQIDAYAACLILERYFQGLAS